MATTKANSKTKAGSKAKTIAEAAIAKNAPVQTEQISKIDENKEPSSNPVLHSSAKEENNDPVNGEQAAASGQSQEIAPEQKGEESFVEFNYPRPLRGLCVVIPYHEQSSIGMELIYALRSWDRHMSDVSIVIVGDKPEFISDEVLHIPHTPESDNPQIDVAHKLMSVIASDLVQSVFVLSNDDIVTLSKITIGDLMLVSAKGVLEKTIETKANVYQENKNRTIKALSDAGLPLYDYATHTPIIYEKDSLADIISKYNADSEGYLISSLYFNTVLPDIRPVIMDAGLNDPYSVSVFRSNPNKEVLDKAIQTRKFLNYNDAGYEAVLPYLEKLFPEKSRFEK